MPHFSALAVLFSISLHAATFNVRESGAKADRTANDAPAIQAAIDACNKAGGGEVVVPAGDYFCGKISLKSQVTLKLEAGATIRASGRAEDYEENPRPEGRFVLFVAEGQENISIVGEGRIEGTGQADLNRRGPLENDRLIPPRRFSIIRFSNCRLVRLRNFSILNSEAHTIILTRCENVFVDNVAILNNFFRINTDGIDPVSCKDVFISNCHIVAGDDCICPKTEQGQPLENLVVENCILESAAAAIKLGTGSSGDFRDIKVSNCVIRNSGVGLGIFMKDGGLVERISFSNISIETTDQKTPINTRLRNNIIPIYLDIEKRDEKSTIGMIRDVTFSNIQIASDNGILIQGMPERAIENLTLQNITFRVNGAFDFSQRTKRAGGRVTYKDDRTTKFIRQPTYVALAHINGLVLDNIRVLIGTNVFKQFDRSAVGIYETKNAVVKNVQRAPAGLKNGQPVIRMNNCEQMLVVDCFAPPGTPAFLGLSGGKTRGIHLAGNDFSDAAKPVVQAGEVPADAVVFARP